MLLDILLISLIAGLIEGRSIDEGYHSGTQTSEATCPQGYELKNGMCYLERTEQMELKCPEDYFLNPNDKLCYRLHPEPCPFNQTTTTMPPETTSATETEIPSELTTETVASETYPTTETTEIVTELATEPNILDPTTEVPDIVSPPGAQLQRCPEGSVFMQDECRKIICSHGEYYNGRCLMPACPEGTVWHGKRCQPPGFVTTILEIENVVKNDQTYDVATENINNIIYHTSAPLNGTVYDDNGEDNGQGQEDYEDEGEEDTVDVPDNLELQPESHETDSEAPTLAVTLSPTSSTTTTNPRTDSTSINSLVPSDGCCKVITPRICKNYGRKWICFNRRYARCDPRVCTRPIIYLKPPRIIDKPPILIMPPNPPLEACQTPDCDQDVRVDCSGCVQNRREFCSPYCYQYYCPNGGCEYMEHQAYCTLYPGEFGCTQLDGCLWDWCSEKC